LFGEVEVVIAVVWMEDGGCMMHGKRVEGGGRNGSVVGVGVGCLDASEVVDLGCKKRDGVYWCRCL
jgi:hypothetical protein